MIWKSQQAYSHSTRHCASNNVLPILPQLWNICQPPCHLDSSFGYRAATLLAFCNGIARAINLYWYSRERESHMVYQPEDNRDISFCLRKRKEGQYAGYQVSWKSCTQARRKVQQLEQPTQVKGAEDSLFSHPSQMPQKVSIWLSWWLNINVL